MAFYLSFVNVASTKPKIERLQLRETTLKRERERERERAIYWSGETDQPAALLWGTPRLLRAGGLVESVAGVFLRVGIEIDMGLVIACTAVFQ